ncbi:hypothetical protein ACG02S_16810 [Roseateles sp. DC23W]|uniref:Uncharacterized protein n=1 Tax=Pelomonas dachongensis TaxID=3299029 RepID=A0ABW7EPX6_9BURK
MPEQLRLWPVFRASALGGGKWLLLLGGLGWSLVVWGRSKDVASHAAYGTLLSYPFLIAACAGTFATMKLERAPRTGWFDSDGKTVMLAVWTWAAGCLSAMVAVMQIAFWQGVLARGNYSLADSASMGVFISTVLAMGAAWPGKRR